MDALPEELAELFRGLELTLLKIIVERIKKAGQINQVGVEAIKALRAHGITLDEIKAAIDETVQLGAEKLDALLDDVVEWNRKYYNSMIDIAGVTKPEHLIDERDIAAIRRQTWGAYRNITTSMGFLVVQKGRLQLLEPAQAYQASLDAALLKVQSGVVSYEVAIADAVRELAKSGLCVAYDKNGKLLENRVAYESGVVTQLDVAVRRCVQTATNQINQRYREQSMEYLQTDIIEVTAHLGARNVLRPGDPPWVAHTYFQGKCYRWKR